jgi:hypothetical protein
VNANRKFAGVSSSKGSRRALAAGKFSAEEVTAVINALCRESAPRRSLRCRVAKRSYVMDKPAFRGFEPKVCSNAPVKNPDERIQPKSANGGEPEDRKRCRSLDVSRFEACLSRCFACPALKCICECADLLISEKPGNLRYRQAAVSQILLGQVTSQLVQDSRES